MGLNESFSSIQTQILAMDRLPNFNKAYNIVLQEEQQKHLSQQAPNVADVTVMAVNKSNSSRFRPSPTNVVPAARDVTHNRLSSQHCSISSIIELSQ